MSGTSILCPNCEAQAENNYCANCGQATHFHQETFLHLVTHFFAHYFHYDSKFWLTLRTLWTKPGALSIAYYKRQRARFVAPASLYIFISIAYFLYSYFINSLYTGLGLSADQTASTSTVAEEIPERFLPKLVYVAGHDKVVPALDAAAPKIFFFMLLVLAIILFLQYRKRTNMYFADHAVFALHIQTFFLTLLFLAELLSFSNFYLTFILAAVVVTGIYFFIASRRFYVVGPAKALLSTFLTGALYIIIVIVTLLTIGYIKYYYL